jgi:Tfp pilus assembly PilM family ATPase
MDRVLDKKLSTPLQIFNPLENIHFLANAGPSHLLKQQGASMAVAMGLALRSI